MAVFITPYTNAEPGNSACFVHVSSTSLEGERSYHASNQEAYLKSQFFLIWRVFHSWVALESKVIHTPFGGAIYCKHMKIFSGDL